MVIGHTTTRTVKYTDKVGLLMVMGETQVNQAVYHLTGVEAVGLSGMKMDRRVVKDVVYLGVSGEPVAISLSKAKQLFDEGVVFVDARGDEYFADGHIQNAWNSGFFMELMFKLDSLQSRDDGAVLYCSDDDCGSSEELAYDLYNEGFTKLFVFQGGWLEWNAAGYPVE